MLIFERNIGFTKYAVYYGFGAYSLVIDDGKLHEVFTGTMADCWAELMEIEYKYKENRKNGNLKK